MPQTPACLAIVPYRPRHKKEQQKQPGQKTPKSAGAALPQEVLHQLFEFFDASTLCRSACTNKNWKAYCEHDKFWVELCKAQWGLLPDNFAPPPDPVKSLYELHHASLQRMRRAPNAFNANHVLMAAIPGLA